MKLSILYRGPLSSCNYGCTYCPFAKTKNTRAELADDKKKLQRFVNWVKGRSEQIGILFTPWGEGLIRNYYQEAMTELSHLPNVWKVAIQTNLACSTAWMDKVNKNTFALWTTFHPTQTTMNKFVTKCQQLDSLGIQYSVGFVAFKDSLETLEELRSKIAPNRYVWANAYKRESNYYTEQDILRIEQIDPLFRYNTIYHPSLGKSCQAGLTSFTLDGDGTVRSCHFIDNPLGNIYDNSFETALKPRPCINNTCGCFIGYVHLDELGLYEKFGDGILERAIIPFG